MQKLYPCIFLLLFLGCFQRNERVILKPIQSTQNASFLYGKYYIDAVTLADNEELNQTGGVSFTLKADSIFAGANFPEFMLTSSEENRSIRVEGKWKAEKGEKGKAMGLKLLVQKTDPQITLSSGVLTGNLFLQNDSVPVFLMNLDDDKTLKFTKSL